MDEPPPSKEATPLELQTLMDAEFDVKGLNASVDEPKLHAALAEAAGIESVSFDEGKVAVRYDPERITEGEICDLIHTAGFQIASAENGPATPPIEPAE